MEATAQKTFGLDAIGQIAQVVDDVDAATAFYRDALGLRFLFAAPGLAFFDCGGVRLMLSRPESEAFDHPGSVLYFRVADVPAAHAALSARGVAFIDAPHVVHRAETYDLWMTFFRDPAGNVLALMAEVPRG